MKDKDSNIINSNKIYSPKLIISCVCLVLLSFLVILGSVIYYRRQILRSTQLIENYENENYDKHYVMITSDSASSFWQTVYAGARDRAAYYHAYLELLGMNLDVEYDEIQLLKIAIESDVDGIIVEANDDQQIADLIDEAIAAGIPVVTVLGDSRGSGRQSFVGISSYNTGHEYGSQICEILREGDVQKKVCHVIVLMDAEKYDVSQNLVYSSIQETVESEYDGEADIEIKAFLISQKTAFAAEEAVRDIFLSEEGIPDIIVCLDEIYTTCAYQAAIDYNKVGKVNILGYYQSDTILGGIAGNVIHSTMTVDARGMGETCIDALKEYTRTGYVSDYIMVDTELIDAENVASYMGGEGYETQTAPAQSDDTK